jgi:methylmalonyl-CoA mutase
MTDQGMVEGGLQEPEELEPEQGSLRLASAEDRATVTDWEAAAAAVLRKAKRLGEDDADELVWEKLTRTTLDGIPITPLGTPDLLADRVTSGRPIRHGDWDVRALVRADDAKVAHEEAMTDLEGGVTSLWLQGSGDTDLGAVLEDVLLDLAPIVLDGVDPEAFLAYAGDRELHPATNLGVPASEATGDLAGRAWQAGIRAFVVDATAVHDRGASDVQELAWSMAAGATYLRNLTGAGLDVDRAAGLVEFRYAATDEQFTTIAKLRAARRLWARVLELSDATTREMRQHAVTSRPMMSKYDPWVNMLRATVAAFAAGVAGADSVTVIPFDSPLGRPDAFGRRIARNTSHLLIDESHVAHVADPAGGSYAVEKLTDDLAVAAWETFGRIEDGADLDQEIAKTVAKREAEIAKRKRPITGLTEFPNLAETLPEREPSPSADEVRRYGASFEALRDEPMSRPVFLATLGTVASHTARATFAANLLAAGGIAVETAGATDGVDALLAAYDGQPVVCLAGADPTYAEWGAAAVEALRNAGATHVIVAGKPGGLEVDDSCAMGIDALDFLTRTREKLA